METLGGEQPTGARPHGAPVGVDLTLLADVYAVCRLPAGAPFPVELLPSASRPGARARSAAGGAADSGVVSLTWTPTETSVICRADRVPAGAVVETGWRCFEVNGPMALTLTGILASIATPLAQARVNIFAFSTFDTDYVLVPAVRLNAALAALTGAGHRIKAA
ncbi:MAG: ACT domain-containing protein [Hamadaea sp.]|uniref:ACT domain-containing protein n=1 Tax=Hamadaea sp. NPDC050747 TaxID=3155789 RepID=UPI0017F7DA8F|nr:ACT domain-containing protein [Hamadaea sp.]NUR47517.1 ACT domain-containing protein [Hamadaea sp.]NUT06037.1 ACT domain-containing protein [Hamadaea sp.]